MTRIMYDGINTDAHLIPADAQLVAGYVDGRYRWSDANWARFPGSVKVRIAVFANTDDGEVLDCEQGNCTPAESVDWVLMRRRGGTDPTVYCGRNTWWSEIRATFAARGVAEPHYWVADYSVDQTHPLIPTAAVALQYRDAGSYDLSIVADYWPGIDPPPLEAEAIMTPDEMTALAQIIENRQLGPSASPPGADAKSTSLGVETASNPSRWAALNAKVDAISAKVDAIDTPTVSPADLTAAMKAALLDPAVLKAIAHAGAVELHTDTPAN